MNEETQPLSAPLGPVIPTETLSNEQAEAIEKSLEAPKVVIKEAERSLSEIQMDFDMSRAAFFATLKAANHFRYHYFEPEIKFLLNEAAPKLKEGATEKEAKTFRKDLKDHKEGVRKHAGIGRIFNNRIDSEINNFIKGMPNEARVAQFENFSNTLIFLVKNLFESKNSTDAMALLQAFNADALEFLFNKEAQAPEGIPAEEVEKAAQSIEKEKEVIESFLKKVEVDK